MNSWDLALGSFLTVVGAVMLALIQGSQRREDREERSRMRAEERADQLKKERMQRLEDAYLRLQRSREVAEDMLQKAITEVRQDAPISVDFREVDFPELSVVVDIHFPELREAYSQYLAIRNMYLDGTGYIRTAGKSKGDLLRDLHKLKNTYSRHADLLAKAMLEIVGNQPGREPPRCARCALDPIPSWLLSPQRAGGPYGPAD